MSGIPEILSLVKRNQYAAAIPLVEAALRGAAAESPERLKETARGIVAYQGFFSNNREAEASVPYFRAVFTVLEELAGPDSAAAMAAAENLAGILGSIGQFDEAIALRERVLIHVRALYPDDDPRHMRVRDGMAFLYRRAGRENDAAALYQDTGICRHLQPAEQYLLAQGARITYRGQPWSKNCHIWLYFDALFDCDHLITTLGLDPCVQIHDHRGTHDGSERGLECTIHHDAVVGLHPSGAGPSTRRIPAANR